jgi:hypothetical protein
MTRISSTSSAWSSSTRLPARALGFEHWRSRLGAKLELLLAESLRIAHAAGVLRTKDLARVTVDTTVQPKATAFQPTPGRCMPPSRGSTNWPKSTPCTCGNRICASPNAGMQLGVIDGEIGLAIEAVGADDFEFPSGRAGLLHGDANAIGSEGV